MNSVAKGFALSAFAVLTTLGAGCDKERDHFQQAINLARSGTMEICAALSYSGHPRDAALCSRGVTQAEAHAAIMIPKQTMTRKRGKYLLTGVELRSIELYRLELNPVCAGAINVPEFAGVKDAFEVCMVGALDFYSRVAQHACDIELGAIAGTETRFCVLKSEPIEQPRPAYTSPQCRTPARNCP